MTEISCKACYILLTVSHVCLKALIMPVGIAVAFVEYNVSYCVELELFSSLKKKQMVPILDYCNVVYLCIVLIDNFCRMMTDELLTCNFAREREREQASQLRITLDRTGDFGSHTIVNPGLRFRFPLLVRLFILLVFVLDILFFM